MCYGYSSSDWEKYLIISFLHEVLDMKITNEVCSQAVFSHKIYGREMCSLRNKMTVNFKPYNMVAEKKIWRDKDASKVILSFILHHIIP